MRRLAMAVLVGLVASACASGETVELPGTTKVPLPTITSVPTTSLPDAATTAGSTATTAASAGACAGKPSVPVPASALDLTSAAGDLDGDGLFDTFYVFDDGETWHVHVELAGGHGLQANLTPVDPDATPWAEEVIDVGVAEGLGLVGKGLTPAGSTYGVWQLADCELHETTLDGEPFEPYLGSGQLHAESFACTSGGLVQYESVQPGADDNVWSVTEYPYAWLPGLGDFQSEQPSTYVTDRASAMIGIHVRIGCPTSPDNDNDGMSDAVELLTYGTDPLDPDTDGDGLPDLQEIVDGNDPLDPDSP